MTQRRLASSHRLISDTLATLWDEHNEKALPKAHCIACKLMVLYLAEPFVLMVLGVNMWLPRSAPDLEMPFASL